MHVCVSFLPAIFYLNAKNITALNALTDTVSVLDTHRHTIVNKAASISGTEGKFSRVFILEASYDMMNASIHTLLTFSFRSNDKGLSCSKWTTGIRQLGVIGMI